MSQYLGSLPIRHCFMPPPPGWDLSFLMVHFSPKFVVLKYIFFPLKHFKIQKIVEKFRQKCDVTHVANPLTPLL